MKMIKGKMVGEGAYGKVYLASSPSQSDDFAVKRNIMESEVDFAGNLREPDILLRLKGHPNIVTMHEVIHGAPFSVGKCSPTRNGYKDD
jgi:serine/threonine protein kinase